MTSRLTELRVTAARPVFLNAAMLYGSTLITSALGFGFWIAAARLFPIDSVGVASAGISAMTLLSQFGLLGMGTLLISEIAGSGDVFPVGLVSAAVMLAGTFSFGLGLAYVALQGVVSTNLGQLGHGVFGPVLFAAGTGITAITVVLDDATIGINRGSLQLARNTVFSLVKLILLPLAYLVLNGPWALVLYGTWTAGTIVSLATFFLHVRRTGIRPVLTPAFRSLNAVRRAAFGHHWLNLSLQVPRLLLPVIVSATLSAASTAAFYEANLIVGFFGIIPAHLSTALFALPRGDDERLAIELRAALRVALGLAVLSAVAFAALSDPILLVFGRKYTVAATSMALLGLSTIPFTVKVMYATVERVRGKMMRCAAISTAGGALEAGLCVVGVKLWGLAGVSAGLDVALMIEALALWPLVARAAQAPALGIPTWLWHRGAPSADVAAGGADPRGDADHFDDLLALNPLSDSPHQRLRLSDGPSGTALEELMGQAAQHAAGTLPRLPVLDLKKLDTLPAESSRGVDPGGGRSAGLQGRMDLRVLALHHPAAAYAAYALAGGQTPRQLERERPELRRLLETAAGFTIAVLDLDDAFLVAALAIYDGPESFLAGIRGGFSPADRAAVPLALTHLCSRLSDVGVMRVWSPPPGSAGLLDARIMTMFGYHYATFEVRPGDG